MKDVTHEYTSVGQINYKYVNPKNEKFAFLTVYNLGSWEVTRCCPYRQKRNCCF